MMIHRCQILKADLRHYQPELPIWTSVSPIIRVRVLDKQRICHQGRPQRDQRYCNKSQFFLAHTSVERTQRHFG